MLYNCALLALLAPLALAIHPDPIRNFPDGITDVVGAAVHPITTPAKDPADPTTWQAHITDNPNPRATAEEITKLTTALNFMMAANYEGEKLDQWTCYPCQRVPDTQHLATFRDDETAFFAYVAVNPKLKTLVLSFRGTVSREGWIQDFKVWTNPADYPSAKGARVHHGFKKTWESGRDKVMQVMRDAIAKNPGMEIYTVGFSLGGAVAVLAGVDLALANPTRTIHIYTYGQPRVGNKAFAEFVNSRTNIDAMRLVHYNDWVPNSPPAILGYHHHDGEYFVTKAMSKEMVRCARNGHEDKACMISTFPRLDLTLHLHAPGYSF